MSKLEEMQTSVENLKKQVDETLLFADDIKAAIQSNGVEVADGTPVSEYAGKIEGLFEAGKKAEYDEFWDAYQQNGNKTDYKGAFYRWDEKIFRPKYNMAPTDAGELFSNFNIMNKNAIDLVEVLEKLNVSLDFSKCGNLKSLFMGAYISHIGVIDVSSKNNGDGGQFYNCKVETIDKIIVSDTSKYFLAGNAFDFCSSLKNVIFEGVIKGNNLNFSFAWSLTKTSIISIINALSNDTDGLNIKFSLMAANNAFETSTGLADGSTSQEWLDLIATKSNWTISLIDSK